MDVKSFWRYLSNCITTFVIIILIAVRISICFPFTEINYYVRCKSIIIILTIIETVSGCKNEIEDYIAKNTLDMNSFPLNVCPPEYSLLCFSVETLHLIFKDNFYHTLKFYKKKSSVGDCIVSRIAIFTILMGRKYLLEDLSFHIFLRNICIWFPKTLSHENNLTHR